MALLLIQAIDTPAHPDKALDVERYKAGHVLAVRPDDWQFGSWEISSPTTRIVRVPGTVDEYAHLERVNDNSGEPPRNYKLSADEITGVKGNKIQDAKNGEVIVFQKSDFSAVLAVAEVVPEGVKP